MEPGTKLGHYEILAPLGAGGMGEVYRARDSTLDRDVAIKVLPAALSTDPGLLARFKREARTLAALDHPGIVTIYSVEASMSFSSSKRYTSAWSVGILESMDRCFFKFCNLSMARFSCREIISCDKPKKGPTSRSE